MQIRKDLVATAILAIFLFCGMALLSPHVSIPHYLASTAILGFLLLVLIVRTGLLSLPVLIYVIAYIPSLAPFYAWNVVDLPYFSLVAKKVQTIDLANETVVVFAVSAMFFVFFSTKRPTTKLNDVKNVTYLDYRSAFWLGIAVLMSAYISDPGPTILTSTYVEVLNARFESSPLRNFAISLLGGLWVALFVFGRHHKYTLIIVSVIALTWLILHARRVEALGAVVFLVIWYSSRIPRARMILLGIAFLAVQIFVEVARSQSVMEFFFGSSTSATVRAVEAGRGALPGGASNVFLSAVHLVNIQNNTEFVKTCCITIFDWVRSPIPNPIWNMAGFPSVTTEHQVIFENLQLAYVGGMSLVAAVYLNGGYILTAVLASCFAILISHIQSRVQIASANRTDIGGTFGDFMFGVFVIYIFRFLWYNPQTPIRALTYSLLLYCILRIFFKKNRH